MMIVSSDFIKFFENIDHYTLFCDFQVIWYHNDIPVKESDNIQLLFKGDKCSLHIKETHIDDEGVYKVIAINSAGDIPSTCRLDVTSQYPVYYVFILAFHQI